MTSNQASHALALSASVNRFLNLISHAGMNMFNLSKYYDVAKHLGIPRWIVDVRHDTSHGQMPSYEILKAAVSFCFHWTLKNYWEFEYNSSNDELDSGVDYEYFHELLDCYKYFKIYSLWGNKTLSEIRGQTEIYEQLYKFVSSLKQNESSEPKKKKRKKNNDNKNIISISDTSVILRNKIEKIIKQKNHKSVKVLLLTLCKEELLIPGEDMIQSLVEGKDDSNILPRNLVKIWSDVISMISQAGMIPSLLNILIENPQSNSFNEKVCNSWVSRIIGQLSAIHKVNKSGQMLKITKADQDPEDINQFVFKYIASGNPSLKMHFDSLAKICDPPISTEKVSKIKKVMEILNSSDFEMVTDSDVKTLEDISGSEKESSKSNNIWTKVSNDNMVFGLCDIKSFPMIEEETKCPAWLDDCKDEVSQLNWRKLMQKFE